MLNLSDIDKKNLESIIQWDRDFNCFYEPVAVRISQSIAATTFAGLKHTLTSLTHTLPTFAVMHMQYNFNLLEKGSVSTLANLACDRAKMAPFNQWFSIFGDSKAHVKYLKTDGVESAPLPTGYAWQEFAIKSDYFHEKMHKLLRSTFQHLTDIFDHSLHQFKILHDDQSIEYIFFDPHAKETSQKSLLDLSEKLKHTYDLAFSRAQGPHMASVLQVLGECAQVDVRPKEIHLRLTTNTHKGALSLNVSIFEDKFLAHL